MGCAAQKNTKKHTERARRLDDDLNAIQNVGMN